MRFQLLRRMRAFLCGLIAATLLHADDGHEAWLRYAQVEGSDAARALPAAIFVTGDSPILAGARQELQRAFGYAGPPEALRGPMGLRLHGSWRGTAGAVGRGQS